MNNKPTTLKVRIANLLPDVKEGRRGFTTRQIVARLNSSTRFSSVANATVRGRLSELVAEGTVVRETKPNGTSTFYNAYRAF
jgi:hypothetical protein